MPAVQMQRKETRNYASSNPGFLKPESRWPYPFVTCERVEPSFTISSNATLNPVSQDNQI
jgi:hypothetical protein